MSDDAQTPPRSDAGSAFAVPAPALNLTLGGIALAALLIASGNIASRVLGLVRESTIAAFFGLGLRVDAYTAAWYIPSTIYDFLITGAISAALVPVFSAYAEEDDETFWRVGSSVINLALLLLLTLTGLLWWQAPLVVQLLAQNTQPGFQTQVVGLVRMMLPAVPLMGLSGLLTALLYARRKFLLPAFVAAAFNACIILGAVLLHNRLGVGSLAAGVLLGALVQVLIQLPALRDMRYYPRIDLRHPGTRRILMLYAPVMLGMGFSIIGGVIDRWLASGLEGALSAMRYATTLVQFPLGLVATAVSTAVLPTLSRQDAAADEESFRRTLGMGLKVVLLLIVPATVGLAALAGPITALLFQRGAFNISDSRVTALALLCYLPGMPAAALDQMLLFAFYARKNTLTPNLVQGAAIGLYLLTALPLLFGTHLGFLALVLGNSAQWIGHGLILLLLVQRGVSLHGLRLRGELMRTVLAGLVMGAVVFCLASAMVSVAAGGAVPYLARPLVQIAVAGSVGAIVYFGLCVALRVESLGFFIGALRRKIGR